MSKATSVIHFWNYAPLWMVILISFVSLAVLMAITVLLEKNKKVLKFFNAVILIATTSLILYFTILMREPSDSKTLYLVPFDAIIRAQKQKTIYREIWLNVLMFVPFGMILPTLWMLSDKWVIFIGVCLSSFIEVVQFIFRLGTYEVDDVIANTIGVAIGIVCLHITKYIMKRNGGSI